MAIATVESGKPLDQIFSTEKNRGREEERLIEVYRPAKKLENYSSVKWIIHVKRNRTREEDKELKSHYYITSIKELNAELFAQIIRKHWQVENNLHWVKDVIMREDSESYSTKNQTKHNALYASFAISILKRAGYQSIKEALEWINNRPRKIWNIMRS